jgi:carbon monoxide dehydrogenase subunit G
MASIRRQIVIDADPDAVWDALRDWDALHYRLAARFVTDTQRDGTARIVTFASGATVREEILGCDQEHRRLAWSVVGGPYTHHNGAAEVLPDTGGCTRFVWTADLQPDTLAEATARAMEDGLAAIKRTLESGATDPETAEVGIGQLATGAAPVVVRP